MEAIREMVNILEDNPRLDIKSLAGNYLLDLSGSKESLQLLIQEPKTFKVLIALTREEVKDVAKTACLAIVNISADVDGARGLLGDDVNSGEVNVVGMLLGFVLDRRSPLGDPACMAVSNLTRSASNLGPFLALLDRSSVRLDDLVTAFNSVDGGRSNLHYLGPVFSNLAQSPAVRKSLMDPDHGESFRRLLAFANFTSSTVRRGGIVGTLRNCCFDIDCHSWLLSPGVDLLPFLLLPLMGPEELDEEDLSKLPPDLQARHLLQEGNTREPDPDIRRMLLEALTQLCATRAGREHLREHNTYVIVRELHKSEGDRAALLACENLVDILLRTEEEIGEDNLRSLDVPEDLQEKFRRMDLDFLADK